MKSYRQSIKKRVFAGFIFAYLLLFTPEYLTMPKKITTEAELYRLNHGFPIRFVPHEMGTETDFTWEATHLPKTYHGTSPSRRTDLFWLLLSPLRHLFNLVLPLYIMNIAICMLLLEWVMYAYERARKNTN